MVPLLVVAGFPGAGKTYATQRLAQALSARGTRTQLLLYDVRDFGLGGGRSDRTRQLRGYGTAGSPTGMLCGSVHEILHALRHTLPQNDSIMSVEVTGTATTDDLLAHLTTDKRLEQFTLPLQLTVVDAPRWQTRGVHNELERAQVSTATHVLLNWTEQLKPGEETELRRAIGRLNPQVTVASEDGFAEWLHNLTKQVRESGDRAAVPVSAKARREVAHLHTPPFGVAVLQVPEAVDRTSFERFVRTLPESVVRAKGQVRFADMPAAIVSWSKLPGQQDVMLEGEPVESKDRPSAVFVGVDLPVRELAEGLSALSPPRARAQAGEAVKKTSFH